jgi:hypothetical protein
VTSEIPQAVIDRFGLDTAWYGKYADAWGLPVLGPHCLQDATLERARAQLGTLLQTRPRGPVPEMDRRGVRLVIVARGEKMSAIPEVLDTFGTRLDERYWGGFGAVDRFPISASTEDNILHGRGHENVHVHEFAHTLHIMALRHIDRAFRRELDRAWRAAQAAGRWANTYAGSNEAEYFAEGAQVYFGVNFTGPPGGDGVHNDIDTRDKLRDYDRPLFDLFERIYRGVELPAAAR